MTKEKQSSSQAQWFSHTLPNGLRIIQETSPTGIVYCGYVVKAGTRHEEPEDFGMAHFIEHLSFKGTENRKAYNISNGLERVGGDLNAYTTKQETIYYATILQEDFPRAVDLLTDIVFHSIYPQHEIDREVEVICDEIDSYKDSPSDLIFDEFEHVLFPDHPLGRDILGQPERLRSYTTADARRFADRYYRPSNAVFYVYGNLSFSRIVHLLERATSDLTAAPAPVEEPRILTPLKVTRQRLPKETHQTHFLAGCRTFDGLDKRRFALSLFNNILGGPGMNARLNVAMREKAGLVYSVESSLASYPDIGTWNVYFGCDAEDLDRCCRIYRRELLKFVEAPITPTQLAAAKRQLVGQIRISKDNFENYSIAMGRAFAHYNVHRDLEKLCQSINEVTADEIYQMIAYHFRPEMMCELVYLSK